MVGDYWGDVIRVDLDSESILRRSVAGNGISAITRHDEHVAACSYDGTVYLIRPDLTVDQALRAMQQKLSAVS